MENLDYTITEYQDYSRIELESDEVIYDYISLANAERLDYSELNEYI